MVERTITVGTYFDVSDIRRVADIISEMGNNEQLVVAMSNRDSYKADQLFPVFERHNFEWSTKGGHDGHEFYVIAKRKNEEEGK